MNTRNLLSGAAALALLCSAGGCGQNESEQTHAEVQQNSGASDISATDAPVSTEPAGTTGTSSVATTAVSTTPVPGTQPQFCVTTNPPVSTREPQDNPHADKAGSVCKLAGGSGSGNRDLGWGDIPHRTWYYHLPGYDIWIQAKSDFGNHI